MKYFIYLCIQIRNLKQLFMRKLLLLFTLFISLMINAQCRNKSFMKKYFLSIFAIVLFLFISVTTSAQNWTIVDYNAPELLSKKYEKAYEYKVEGVGRFVFWDFEEPVFQLFSDNGQFLTEAFDSPTKTFIGAMIMVATYRKSGMMASQFELWLDKRRDIDGNCLQTETKFNGVVINGSRNKGLTKKEKLRRIFHYLKDGGYIELTANIFGGQTFFIRIYPLDDTKKE